MSDMLAQLHTLMADVIVPHLKGIQASQAKQRIQTESLNRSLEEFRAEMLSHFSEVRAELASARMQLEDTMITFSETEPEAVPEAEVLPLAKKTLIH